jgi:hypothetical protein
MGWRQVVEVLVRREKERVAHRCGRSNPKVVLAHLSVRGSADGIELGVCFMKNA